MNRSFASLFSLVCVASLLPAAPADEPPLLKVVNLNQLNTAADEDEPHLATDGLQLFYTATNDKRKADLFVSLRKTHSQSWPRGILVDGYFAEKADNCDTCLTLEGKYPQFLYFSTNKDPEKKEGKSENFDIYVAVRQDRKAAFTAPTPVHGICTERDERHPWLTADGKQLYFSRKTKEGWRVFVATRAAKGAGGYVDPKQLDLPVNFHHATLSRDGKTMYLQGPLEQNGDKTRWGIFRSTRAAESWNKPEAVAGLNHPKAERGDMSPSLGVVLDRNGRATAELLYFTSDRPGGKGGLDLWVIPTWKLPRETK